MKYKLTVMFYLDGEDRRRNLIELCRYRRAIEVVAPGTRFVIAAGHIIDLAPHDEPVVRVGGGTKK